MADDPTPQAGAGAPAELAAHDWSAFIDAVKAAVAAGPAGEARLVAALGSLPAGQRTIVVAALGDARGDAGVPALRRLLQQPGETRDSRCAALLALAKREGVAASDVLAGHLDTGERALTDYAVIGLAVVGDDRAWDPVHDLLDQELRRPARIAAAGPLRQGSAEFVAIVMVTYLVRHLAGPAGRRIRLAETVRRRFDRFHAAEREWLAGHWPGVAPGGPAPDRLPPPDPRPFRAWVADPLFGPVF